MMYNQHTMLLVTVVALLYVMTIMRFTFGWFSLKKTSSSKSGPESTTTFSVIVAARNEEGMITRCLDAIAGQGYPSDLFELIVVNDHSTDLTESEVRAFVMAHPGLSIRLLKATGEGKKSAITQGINAATGKLILVTDADCSMSPGWIRSFALAYEKSGTQCISGPVKMTGKGIFSDLQALEFMSLVGSGAGSIGAGMPVMCNGANFCYEKSIFEAVGGFEGNDHYASGDDIFLMLKVSKQFGVNAIGFLKDPDAIVTTDAQPDLLSFLRQRLRWVSKSPGYIDYGILMTTIAVLAINIGLLMACVYGFQTGLWQPFLLLTVSKLIVDLPLMIVVATFMNQKRFLVYYLPLQFILPFYVVFTAIGGVLSTVSWKGRPVK